MFAELDTGDWAEVFKYAGASASDWSDPSELPGPVLGFEDWEPRAYDREDVAEIIAIVDGDNDGPDWLGVFVMTDGVYLVIRAGCDYTGWG